MEFEINKFYGSITFFDYLRDAGKFLGTINFFSVFRLELIR